LEGTHKHQDLWKSDSYFKEDKTTIHRPTLSLQTGYAVSQKPGYTILSIQKQSTDAC